MENKMKQLIKRSLNGKGQICVPAALRSDNIKSYMVEEHDIDKNGNVILKLYPIEKEETDKNAEK